MEPNRQQAVGGSRKPASANQQVEYGGQQATALNVLHRVQTLRASPATASCFVLNVLHRVQTLRASPQSQADALSIVKILYNQKEDGCQQATANMREREQTS